MKIYEMTAAQVAAQLHSGKLTVREVLLALAARIEEADAELNCITHMDLQAALAEAERVQAQLDSGVIASPLAGVPVAVKDNICEKGKPATCASKMLQGFVPPYDATVIARVKDAGMIPFCRLNMDEFAMGSTTETSVYGAVKNPHNHARVAGGSSGGAAAAVAAGECLLAIATDTGGSIRQPASFCGVTGLKPTYGAVSRYGLIAFASSLDTVGVIAKDTRDAALLYDIIKGKDPRDATSAASPDLVAEEIYQLRTKGLRIGIMNELITDEVAPAVLAELCNATEIFESCGADVRCFEFPMAQYAVPAYYILSAAEASSNLARYDGIRYGFRYADAATPEELYRRSRTEGFGSEVKKRIMLGNFVLSAGYFDNYYKKALQVKEKICNAFDTVFERFDLILAPVAPETAYPVGADKVKLYQNDKYTALANLAGLPALALPCGKDSDGMPVGLQLIGKPFAEQTLLQAGFAFEKMYGAMKGGAV